MVLPLLLGPVLTIFSVADAAVWLGSGKDIIQHLTGVDVLGTVLGCFGIKDGPDWSGVVSSLDDIYIMIIVSIVAIIVVGAYALMKPKPKSRKGRR